MTRHFLIVTLICGLIFTGLLATRVKAFDVLLKEDFVTKTVLKEHLIKTAENAIFLFDASSSMGKPYKDTNMSRMEIAKKTLKERNAYLPELGHNFGLYLYTPWKPLYPMQAYNKEQFAQAIEQLPDKYVSGTFLLEGLSRLDKLIEPLHGRTAVFILTDGTYSKTGGPHRTPATIAKNLTEKYNVCFYIISTADDEASQKVLEKAASVDFCARVLPFEAFIERPEYNTGALFVTKATENIETVTEVKIAGVKVDNILFDFDKADISSKASRELTKLAEFMQENSEAYIVLAGYADSTGSEEYNMELSLRRVGIVTEYLKNKFNISSDRILPLWFGEINPIADNSTAEGRRLNRRVEIAVGGV